MKCNMDLLSEILPELERQSFTGNYLTVEITEHPPEEINFHLTLLHHAGLIDARKMKATTLPLRITWDAYEFADSCSGHQPVA